MIPSLGVFLIDPIGVDRKVLLEGRLSCGVGVVYEWEGVGCGT